MKKIYLIANNILDFKSQKLRIGGVQTYVWNLVELLKITGYTPIIIQTSENDFKKIEQGIEILGIKLGGKKLLRTHPIKSYLNKIIKEEDIVIFSTETLNFKNNFKKSISIQHGIYWDMDKSPLLKSQIIEDAINGARSYYIRRRIKQAKLVVCVDYNFVNWYRTQEAKNKNLFRIIPNFSEINYKHHKNKNNEKIKIIFARRFEIYRGTRLFSNVVEKLLEVYFNIEVIFAGEGSDSKYLKEKFGGIDRVKFIKYEYNESLKIHETIDIAVIPTTGSEGTSLSALEALSSKCAVVSSNVGGLSNIIIDNFNGLLINPVEKELYEALKRLIENEELRKKLAINGFNTVKEAFNKINWNKKWFDVIKEIEKL